MRCLVQHHFDLLQQKHQFRGAAGLLPNGGEQIIHQGTGFHILRCCSSPASRPQFLGLLCGLSWQHLFRLKPQSFQLCAHLLKFLLGPSTRFEFSGCRAFLFGSRFFFHLRDLGADGVVFFQHGGFRFGADHLSHLFHFRFHPFGLTDRFRFGNFRVSHNLCNPASTN